MKLTIDELAEALKEIKDIQQFRKEEVESNPVFKLVVDQFQYFTKEQLESVIPKRERNLYRLLFNSRNSYLFGYLLETGAFRNELTNETKWILDNIKPITLEKNRLLYFLQKTKHSENKREESTQLILDFFYDYKMPDVVIDKLYKRFVKTSPDQFLEYIVATAYDKPTNIDRLIEHVVNDGIDNNGNGILNGLLSKKHSDLSSSYQQLYIEARNVDKIKILLKKGFRFNEEKFDHYGETLFTALLNGKHQGLLPDIALTLDNVFPNEGTIESQRELVDSYRDKNYYPDLKAYFEYKILDNKLSRDRENLPKVKGVKI